MADTWDTPHYTNVQMPFEGLPPEIPELNPTGVYEREFEVPAAGWAGRRVVLHVGAAESVLIVSLNGDEIGVGKDSHLASEFDLTDRLRPGSNTLRLTRRQVVRRDLRRGPGPVVARRDHPSVFLYATRDVYLADVRVGCRPGGDDLSTGTLDLTVTVGFPGRELPPGWTVEATLDGHGRDAARAAASSVDRTDPAGLDPRRSSASCTSTPRACCRAEDEPAWTTSTAGWRRRSTAS